MRARNPLKMAFWARFVEPNLANTQNLCVQKNNFEKKFCRMEKKSKNEFLWTFFDKKIRKLSQNLLKNFVKLIIDYQRGLRSRIFSKICSKLLKNDFRVIFGSFFPLLTAKPSKSDRLKSLKAILPY